MASTPQTKTAPGVDHHDYAIVFRQHTDAPKTFKTRWCALLKTIKANPDRVIADWLCRLRSSGGCCTSGDPAGDDNNTPPRNTDLVLLERCEGGIGGNDNRTCRQIRFCMPHDIPWARYNEIRLTALASSDGKDVWTPAELCVYRDTFSDLIISTLGTEAHEKRIEVAV